MHSDNRLKLNAQISEEAAEWFVEFRTGDIDAAGRSAFDTWVRSSQEHLRAYLELAAIWNEGGSLDAQRALDIEALIALARQEGNVVLLEGRSLEAPDSRLARDNEEARGPARKYPTGTRRWAIAASLAFLTLATATLGWLQFHAPTYATDIGEQRSIRLPDGSTVLLNSQSRVRVNFTVAERAVELLEGQALFQVAKNPARPFVVSSDDTRVRAVGTQFDVDRRRRGTIITVVEGKVAILAGAADAEHDLVAGEQLTVTALAAPRPTRVNVAAVTAWTQRQIVLESVELTEVVEAFNRYSARRLVVEDSAPGVLRLSGVFATDPDFLIRYLRERPDITVRETEKEIRIIRHD